MAGWNKKRRCSRDQLLELYVAQQLGATEIKRILGLSSEKSIYLLLKQYNIPSRSLSQSATIRESRKKEQCEVT